MSNLDINIENIRQLPVIQNICDDLGERLKKKTVVISIDGRCGAGKTTLANAIESIFDATVIHMDDFFLPPSLRNPERLEETGGNFHYERFEKEVVEPIKSNDALSYRIFSCEKMDYIDTVNVKPKKLIIVEGSYSAHPKFKDFYDMKIFCDVDQVTQQNRIIKRNGMEQFQNFKNKWIPMEEKYFKEFDIKEKSDYVVELLD